MIPLLLPFFLLTGVMLGGAAYFVSLYIFPEVTTRRLGRIRNGLSVAVILGPLVYFGLYMLAKPKGDSEAEVTADVALIPAIWVGFLLLGAAIGLARAVVVRQRPQAPGRRP